ncbi:DUF3826 domain-containing protein [Niabella hirudinis]|uniref:DUF3826 domain-containing protein n=1 Tax=Niabella hirudinis TaxID=1285929 RepID=UPI003EBB96D2
MTIFNLPGLSAQSGDSHLDYRQVIGQRAYKIVAPLQLKDSSAFYRVQQMVVQQYIDLRDLDAHRESGVADIKAALTDKEQIQKKIAEADAKTEADRAALHKRYIQKLSHILGKDQVDIIKNGMTYNVLPITYKGYLEMIPRLTTEERKFILDALTEAREHAMDAGSSEKKHAWFGKYKGRINNYLSARGYDMNKESKAWQERMKTNQNKKQQPKQ